MGDEGRNVIAATMLMLFVSGCSALNSSDFTVAPAAADRPVIWLRIVSHSAVPTDLEFAGLTAGHSGRTELTIPACSGLVYGIPIEETWSITISGITILESSDVPPVERDSVANIGIGADQAPNVSFRPGERPAQPSSPADC